jgi:hypothetical protein
MKNYPPMKTNHNEMIKIIRPIRVIRGLHE